MELDKFGIEQSIFSQIIGDVKDKTFSLKSIIDKQRLNNNEIIYVGDTEHDIRAAQIANVISVASTYGYQSKNRLAKSNPEYFIHKPLDLIQVVEEINSVY